MKSETMKGHQLELFRSALGPDILHLFEDPAIEEIMRNPDGLVWIDRYGEGQILVGPLQSDVNAKRTIEIVASACGKIADREHQRLSGEIPGLGYRFQGVLPDAVNSPAWNIRIPSKKIYTLDDYVAAGIMTAEQQQKLTAAVIEGRNILVVGGTKSGKTTLLNALLVISSTTNERHILIEDTGELRCTAENKVHLHSNQYASSADLLEVTMRLSPKRIIVGEAKRGPDAYTLLMASNTGHKGIQCTIHANSAKDGLERIEELLTESGMIPVPRAIARAIDIIVYIEATRQGRTIREIVEVQGYTNDYLLTPL